MTTSKTISDQNQSAETQVSFATRGVRKRVLPNGLTVITKELHDKPIVASIIWYRVGSRNEELGQTGKSHFLEHMLFKGTDRYRRGEIDMITLKNGGANNAFTWLDFTAYYFTFSSDRWQAALDIEANRMRNTTFAQEEFDSEKQVVEEELRIGLDGPWEALENEVWATAFRRHPYHWPTVGWFEDLERATAEEMKAYYDKWYHPRNATIVLVGDFNTEETVARIEELFSPIPPGPEIKTLDLAEPPQKGEKRVIVKKETHVERLVIGYHVPAVGHPDAHALHILETLLSSGRSSRLYKRLLDKDQSVTLANASYNDHIDASLFYIQSELKPGYKLDDVERAIYEEIERLQHEELPEVELTKAKRQIEADLVLTNEEPLQQAILLGQYETIASSDSIPEHSRGYKYLGTMMDGIFAVTAEDVARVARKYLVQDNRTVGFLINDETKEASAVSGEVPGPAHRSRPSGAPQAGPFGPTGHGKNGAAFRTGERAGAFLEEMDRGLMLDSGSAPESRAGSPSAGDDASARDGGPSQNASSNTSPKLDVERVELPNGLVLLLSENHSTPSVAINAVVRAGSRFEPDEKAGLASLVGELIDEGTETRTSQEIAFAVEEVGGRLGTFGDYQASGAHASLLSRDTALGLEIVADVLMNATFPPDKVKQQVDRRLAQIKSRLDVPRVQASDIFNKVIFKGTPQHRPPVGYQESIRNLTREDMIDFYRRFYVPNNTIISIVGDIDKASVKAMAEERLGPWGRDAQLELPELIAPEMQTEAIEKFIHAPKEQVNIFIGHVGIDRRNPDYYTLRVMDTILGSSPGFTSRIPRILRDEQGLAYTTFSNITGSAGIDLGRFIAYIGTSPDNLEQALAGLRREIARIVAEPVTREELETAKAYLTGNFVFDFQSNSQVAEFLVDAEVYGLEFDYLERYPEKIRHVTVDDITRVTRKYLDPHRL
ncbi:MAG TPA: pitrilysin family protein, partial [Blastocatellia bacterium]|nr:pitrilysin family protein [Blastocatellia bacterium]